MQLDFNQISQTVNLLEFITKEYPEYSIDPNKSEKNQTRLVSANEEIDVYKGNKGWLYFNRTDPHKTSIKDEGNIIQFLKVRHENNWTQIIRHLRNYLSNMDKAAEPIKEVTRDPSKSKIDWNTLIKPLSKLNARYLESRSLNISRLLKFPSILNQVISFSYRNKHKITTQISGFPLRNKDLEIMGVELRKEPYKENSGKFSAPGSLKERSFWIVQSSNPQKAFLAESPIDILSYMQLNGYNDKAIYIATAGRFSAAKASDISTQILNNGAKDITLLCDNDIHGQSMNLSLASVLLSPNPEMPSYFKTHVKKDKETLVIEVNNLDSDFKSTLKNTPDIKIISEGTNYLSFEANYTPKIITDLLKLLQSRSEGVNVQIHKPSSKDWNQELQDKKTKSIEV